MHNRRADFLRLYQEHFPEFVEAIRNEREYRIPRGYLPWKDLSVMIANSVQVVDADVHVGVTNDPVPKLMACALALWWAKDMPLYCLSTPLLRAIEQTVVAQKKDLFQNWEPPLPGLLVLLPKNAIHTPEGPLDYLLIECFSSRKPEWYTEWKRNVLALIPDGHITEQISCCCVDEAGYAWHCEIAMIDGQIVERGMKSNITKVEEPTIELLKNLALNILLILSYRPELITSDTGAQISLSRGSGRGQRRGQKTVLTPRWLGKNYQVARRLVVLPQGSHARPQTHWRKGHWRFIEPGEGKRWKKGKQIWIEPCLINAK